jgi:lactate permease
MVWSQVYNPTGNAFVSTLLAAIPVIVLLGGLGIFHIRAHIAAIAGLAAALVLAIFVFQMPASMAGQAALFGGSFALIGICWIIFNLIFLYRMTVDTGNFRILQESIAGITNDRRLQLLLIAFCFGAFFEGAAGGGTPVAVTGAILIGLGFHPLAASGLSLIANTAPVAYGGMGTPIIVLQSVTNIDLLELSAMVGRQLPFFSLLVPFWLVIAFAGWRGMAQVWPAILVAGASFAIPQFFISNYHGPWLVDVGAAMISMAAVALFLKVWHPKQVWTSAEPGAASVSWEEARRLHASHGHSKEQVRRAWMPWIIMTAVILVWGLPTIKNLLNIPGVTLFKLPIDGLHNVVQRVPPVVPQPHTEAAVLNLNWLTATGTGLLISAILAGLYMRVSLGRQLRIFLGTAKVLRFSILTIVAMLALGYTTRYSGMDATMGLAFAQTGWFYPFFGTLIGWLGVALTGTDAASNALFGSQQVITANQLNLNPTLMAAANSSGGVMGKMIDAQSIVVASTATNYYGKEGIILRYVFLHSIALAALVGVLVMLQAYVPPFTLLTEGLPRMGAP